MLKKFRGCAAVLTAAIVMLSAFAASAATGVTITEVKVGTDANSLNSITLADSADGAASVLITPESLIQVTGTVTAPAAADEGAFISKKAAETTYSNDTIQYVDQQPVVVSGETGTVTITFRPRDGYLGVYDMKMGATSAAASATKYYTVAAAKETPVLAETAVSKTIGVDTQAIVNITEKYSNAWATAVLPKIGDNESDAVEISGEDSTGTGRITIDLTKAAFANEGTVTITLEADGYDTLTIAVTMVKPEPQKVDAGAAYALAGLNINSTLYAAGDSIALPAIITANEVTMTLSWVVGANDAVTYANNTLTYNTAVESITTITATATIDDSEISKTFTIVLMPAGTTELAFGNICGTRENIFASQANLAAYIAEEGNAADIAALKAEALNVALGRNCHTTLADNGNTLDYNRDRKVSLSEYEIFARMMNGHDRFTVDAVKAARPAKAE